MTLPWGYDGGMATNIPQDDFQKTALRLPKDLHARLHESAAAVGRSYNAEIVARLAQSFEPSGDVTHLQEVAESRKEVAKRLGQLNYALALALEELANYVPEDMLTPGGAAEKSVRMARALARSEQVTIYKNTIMASMPDSDLVTHLDLQQNIDQLERLTPTKPALKSATERLQDEIKRQKSNKKRT